MKVFGPAAGLSAKFAVVSGRAQPAADQAVLTDYRLAVEQLEARLETVDAALVALAQTEPFRPPVGWLRCFRGIDTLTAITLVAELHDVRRFTSARALMAYVGWCQASTPAVRRGDGAASPRSGTRTPGAW